MPTYERLDYGSPDGSQWGGATTDLLGFYGVTPVTQSTQVNVSSGGVDTSTVVSTLVVALKRIGIVG